ncbi:hypothetical protein AB1Y20_005152 [Prymnesium parvum]|uniref:Alpha-amylase n=1 Tax=Prymnesium parvum TaxID=97485 RepID=A0AB34J5F8_PRYPA
MASPASTASCLWWLLPTAVAWASGSEISTPMRLELMPQHGLSSASPHEAAVCLDGSDAGFYFAPSTTGSRQKFHIHLEGGGWCDSPASCKARSQGYFGSSSSWGDTLSPDAAEGLLSDSCDENPEFCEHNRVYVKYCDGTSYTGDLAHPLLVDGTRVYLRGGRIVEAVLQALLPKGLAEATEVLLSGCSAGALGAMVRADAIHHAVRRLAPRLSRFGVLPLSGFFSARASLEGRFLFAEQMRRVYELSNASASISRSCASAFNDAPWRCLLSANAAAHLSTHTFVVNSALDSWQTSLVLGREEDGALECDADTALGECGKEREELEVCTDDGMEELNAFARDFVDQVTAVAALRAAGSGAFLHSCHTHCAAVKSPAYHTLASGGVLLHEAIGAWWRSLAAPQPAAQHTYASPCEYATVRRQLPGVVLPEPRQCNPTCPPTEACDRLFGPCDDEPTRGKEAALRVACIGDSITMGYRGYMRNHSAHSWPNQLQALLGDAYEVVNLGFDGSTASSAGTDDGRPAAYTSRPQYTTLLQGEWDLVFIMLGTNDAKAANWDSAHCASPPFDACPSYASLLALLRTVRSLHAPASGPPEVFLMRPPPVAGDAILGVLAPLANGPVQRVVVAAAAAAAIDANHTVDVFAALGGEAAHEACAALQPRMERCAGATHLCAATPADAPPHGVCALFCDGEWCDGLHPSDGGLAAIAAAAAAAIGRAHAAAAGAAAEWVGCFQDGELAEDGGAAGCYPEECTHEWSARLADLPGTDAAVCHAACATEGYSLAGVQWAGGAVMQCWCAHSLGALAAPRRALPAYRCCPICMNWMLAQLEAPCVPTVHSCGAWLTMSVYSLGGRPPPDVTPPQPEAPLLNRPCGGAPYAAQPWCDARRAEGERVRDALGRMSLQEKVAALGTGGGAEQGSWEIASLGLREFKWWAEGSHGLTAEHGTKMTNFPMPITTAASFNRSLWRATGAAIGREARSAANIGSAYGTFWAPMINLARDPRWGRNLESAGEDPLVTGEYAAAFVSGVQSTPEDPSFLQASAACKHFAANSMEESTENGVHLTRHDFDAQVPLRDLVDSYLPGFRACVEQGKVSGLMCSYNALNGVPTCANEWLLDSLARREWGFDGYITTDCGAGSGVHLRHRYTSTPVEAVPAILRAGVDMDCGHFLVENAMDAIRLGLITESDIDQRLAKTLSIRFRLGHFDPPGPRDDIVELCSDHARELARDGAAQGTTLVKNNAATLPLRREEAGSVGVIGPLARTGLSVASYYGPANVCEGKWPSMADAIAEHAVASASESGVPTSLSEDTSGIAAAAALAAASDTVVLVLGADLHMAREGIDAASIRLPSGQLSLFQAVVAASRKPIIVLMLTATPLDISAILAHAHVGAVVFAGMPAVNTAGVADVLFGVRPAAGRVVQTVYPASFADGLSIFDMRMRPGGSAYARPDCRHATPAACANGTNPGRTHRFYTGGAVVPFGWGLSYSSIRYEISSAPRAPLSLERLERVLAEAPARQFPSKESLASLPPFRFGVDVINTGSVDTDEVVLGFLIPPKAGEDGRPLQDLFDFKRVHVRAGQRVTVWLEAPQLSFALVNDAGHHVVTEGDFTVRFGVPPPELLLNLEHASSGLAQTVVRTSRSTAPTPPPAERHASLAGKSIYFIKVDRFARDDDNTTPCTGNGWCGGTINGIQSKLDYIQGMGFDCVWITPVVGQYIGQSGASGWGYHGYWARDWYSIDTHFGKAADLLSLSRALKARGMCFVMDVVINHVMPVNGVAALSTIYPFNKPEFFHTYGASPGESFDSYAKHPKSVFEAFPPGCGPGSYQCEGYNEKLVHDGWFYDLADLDQAHPYVHEELLRWVRHMVKAYELDALRLDTAAYVPHDYLRKFQQAAGVDILGEVTTANMSFHASYTKQHDGSPVLKGLLNFPVWSTTVLGFCGKDPKGSLFDVLDTPGPDVTPDLTKLAAVLEEQRKSDLYYDLDLLANFVDNHDVARVATFCASDASRISNALALAFLWRGIPILYAGTEQDLTGDHDNNRDSLWRTGFPVATPIYSFVGALNRIRAEQRIGLSPARVQHVDTCSLVISRGPSFYLFVNNRAASQASNPVAYCMRQPLPPPPNGLAWVDALSGTEAVFAANGCFMADDGAPKVLVLRRRAEHFLYQWLLLLLLLPGFALAIFCRRRRARDRLLAGSQPRSSTGGLQLGSSMVRNQSLGKLWRLGVGGTAWHQMHGSASGHSLSSLGGSRVPSVNDLARTPGLPSVEDIPALEHAPRHVEVLQPHLVREEQCNTTTHQGSWT